MDMQSVMNELGKKRPVFHSEADFQFALAWMIQKKHPDVRIRLEYPYLCKEPFYGKNKKAKTKLNIDILIWQGDNVIPIELKYLTSKISKYEDKKNNEIFNVNSKGKKWGRLDTLEDIARIEHFKNENANCEVGYSIMLTNDASYEQNPPENDKIAKNLKLTGTIGGKYDYYGNADQRATVLINGNYQADWARYSPIHGEKVISFRYMMVKI